jgi:hypothetical protein
MSEKGLRIKGEKKQNASPENEGLRRMLLLALLSCLLNKTAPISSVIFFCLFSFIFVLSVSPVLN